MSKKFFWVLICELLGLSGTIFTAQAIPTWYATLEKPFFQPPNWLFGPVWTVLYALMGLAGTEIWQQTKPRALARRLFLLQLALNISWTPIFFGAKSPEIALAVIILLDCTVIWLITQLLRKQRAAALLLMPYLLWILFATLLNASIILLN